MKRTALHSPSCFIYRAVAATLVVLALAVTTKIFAADSTNAVLPDGVKAVWDVAKAYHEATPTRERICLNGLWQWQPAEAKAERVPAGDWGYFKVPGSWPGITDYMQKDSQTVFAAPAWRVQKLSGINAAWQQRDITIPATWKNRRITAHFEYVNSLAAVYIDGKRAGEVLFPAGEVNLTSLCAPGSTHRLSVLVVALPFKGVMLSYSDSASAREVKGSVPRRGLCGDVFLVSTPTATRIGDVKINTSVRNKELSVRVAVQGLLTEGKYELHARVSKDGASVHEFKSRAFQASDLSEGRFAFTNKWMPDKLWDTHTPQNQYALEVTLVETTGKALDTAWNERFGFREFWIQGRDFYLNGTRIYLSAVPLDNASIGAFEANYAAAKESMERLKGIGINYVYTHNYDCEPGSHLGFAEILRAADDTGMLLGFTQPHFGHYDWKSPDADRTNGYARHAEFYVRVAQNHPAIVFYSTSHNATGYSEDMNPDMIDGTHDPRDEWSAKNVRIALRAEAIISHLDPTRIVYHHAGGNIGSMHTINFYPNFVPVQELSDWFGHWAKEGVKPAFTCEFAAPMSWDWTMYRGWYKGTREFGSAPVPWENCIAEWNAQLFGDRAFQISDEEKTDLRWEARQFRAGKVWHRWDFPVQIGSERFNELYPVYALYLTDNWRAFRTWGLSGISPWEYAPYWKLRPGVKRDRVEYKVDWDNLQRPGFSADYVDDRYDRIDLTHELKDWVPTQAAQALLRNNRPLLAYLAGDTEHFTSKDHTYYDGEEIEKQLIIINNSRETVTADAEWGIIEDKPRTTKKRITLPAGQQERIPIRQEFRMGRPWHVELGAVVKFSNGETQADSLAFDIIPRPAYIVSRAKIALFDPQGETRTWLKQLGIRAQDVEANADLSSFDTLIVGKASLTVGGDAPDISRVRDGLKVVMFEQTSDVLEKRFGFRVNEYGLRQVFPRVSDHPLLAGLSADRLRDWRGESTLLPAQFKYEMRVRYGPTVKWCDIPVVHLWRCGNRGDVASVLIEKPPTGDFLPIVDGGFSLQYSPLMEYREGKGMVLFCQLDVTGRTATEPAAEQFARNLFSYLDTWKAPAHREAVYAGEAAGQAHLAAIGVQARSYEGGKLAPNQTLILGPGCAAKLNGHAQDVGDWLKAGGKALAIKLDAEDAKAALPLNVTFKNAEHIAAFFNSANARSPLAGVGPADVHNRDPRELPLITGGANVLGDGVLASSEDGNVLFCALAPWEFDGTSRWDIKKTQRRSSFLVARLLANLGVAGTAPVLERFHQPVSEPKVEKRFLAGLYLDQPEEWDDPYRFFRW